MPRTARSLLIASAAAILGAAVAYIAGSGLQRDGGAPDIPTPSPLVELAREMLPVDRLDAPARHRLADMLDALADLTARNPDEIATWRDFRDVHRLAGRLAFHEWADRPADPLVAAALDNYLAAALNLELGNIPGDQSIDSAQRRRLVDALESAAEALR